eukprot:TRINITY_DN5158_c1_g3_i2.p1 TRINITY_DN5158_c1_g3~~TRINITY_DN5158_c1_g3_i2.p1  ORF type:complete len:431 (+),score=132.49 TRINITY_DN5158_c1_g3_i2:80-1294(+)
MSVAAASPSAADTRSDGGASDAGGPRRVSCDSCGSCGLTTTSAAASATSLHKGKSGAPETLYVTTVMTFSLPSSGVYTLASNEMQGLPVWKHAAGYWLYSTESRWAVTKTNPSTPHVPVKGLRPLIESSEHLRALPHELGGKAKWMHMSGSEVCVEVSTEPPRPEASAPASPDLEPRDGAEVVSSDAISALPTSEQKDALGEELYNRVSANLPSFVSPADAGMVAGKIVGMLLQVGITQALKLLDSPQLLELKVQEAVGVLKVYEKAYEIEEVRRTGQQGIDKAEATAKRLQQELERVEQKLRAAETEREIAQRELSSRVDFPLRADTLQWAELVALDHRVSEYLHVVRKERLDRRLCRVCMDMESSVVLLPCKHQVLCHGCQDKVDRCPICMREVADRFEPYH